MSNPIYQARGGQTCEICQTPQRCLAGEWACELSGEIHDPFNDRWHDPLTLLVEEELTNPLIGAMELV